MKCHECRSQWRQSVAPCDICGKVFTPKNKSIKRCSWECGKKAISAAMRARGLEARSQPGWMSQDAKGFRRAREHTAPGLKGPARRRILARWKRQGRVCSYCPALADTLDHVIPVSRGGTNWEGNLTPACRACNTKKHNWLYMEWRTGCNVRPPTVVIPYARKPKPPVPPPVQRSLELLSCEVCSTLWLGVAPKGLHRRIRCSDVCAKRTPPSESACTYCGRSNAAAAGLKCCVGLCLGCGAPIRGTGKKGRPPHKCPECRVVEFGAEAKGMCVEESLGSKRLE